VTLPSDPVTLQTRIVLDASVGSISVSFGEIPSAIHIISDLDLQTNDLENVIGVTLTSY